MSAMLAAHKIDPNELMKAFLRNKNTPIMRL